ncbi:MAG: copper chaperone PCu(A)C [Candidatus Thiothrix sulfatifontis]|nr:MAG: copper chaperone PCu(A)C [Candidatus Thiothrix sulfatifontis]
MKRLLHTTILGLLVAMTVACQADADKTAAPATGKAADSVTVENPFVRAIPPGQPNSASFMTLVNTSDSDHSIKSAASPVAATVELHTHTNNNGVMEMRQVPQIDVPAKGRTELKPGGLHVMLIGLQQELKVGETAAITLTFEDGSTTTVNAPIQEVMPAAGAGHMQGM